MKRRHSGDVEAARARYLVDQARAAKLLAQQIDRGNADAVRLASLLLSVGALQLPEMA